MFRAVGFRIDLTHSQARHVSTIRNAGRFVYNWAVERLLQDQTLTNYDLQKEFTKLRRSTPHLQDAERAYLNTAIHQVRTSADVSNKYGKGNLKFRTKKNDDRLAVVCDLPPKYVNNTQASLPGLGIVQLCEEQPYQYPNNWLHCARSFQLVDVTPKRWNRVEPGDRIYRLYVVYELPDASCMSTGVAAGLDRGITNPTVVCKTDGETVQFVCYDTATAFRTNQSWNDGARRTIKRRNPHSRSTRKMKRQRDKYNQGNANDRDYAEWLLAHKICKGVDVICIEDLHLEAMTRRGGRRKKGMNRGMRFIRHSEILRKIKIVAERLGIRIVEVNAKHTSQTCYTCDYKDKENRKDETFRCLACGRLDNADGNASANVTQRGTGMKVPAGGGITLERREMGRTRKPPVLVCAAPDAMRRRENQACNRPKTSSAMKHLGKYAYVTHACSGI